MEKDALNTTNDALTEKTEEKVLAESEQNSGKVVVESIDKSEKWLKDLEEILENQLEMQKSQPKAFGGRDFAQYIAAFKELRKQAGDEDRDKWLTELKELKKLEDAVEELSLGRSDMYKSIFDNGKKNEAFLR